DTHINETDATWDWMEGAEGEFRPKTEVPASSDPKRQATRYWIIDGHRLPRASSEDNGRSLTTAETPELLDPMARLRHMDELGTEVQVIYPTLFLSGVTENPSIDGAIKHSYNRWLADRCGQTNGRLRWVCLPPYTDIPRAIEEIRFAKANGACG